jgi:hypothetical protein
MGLDIPAQGNALGEMHQSTPNTSPERAKQRTTQCRSPAIRIGGTTDHVHILCNLSRTLTIAGFVEEAKTGSSKWLNTIDPEFRTLPWQNGYGAFSIKPVGGGRFGGLHRQPGGTSPAPIVSR